jgi:hypothetical protein
VSATYLDDGYRSGKDGKQEPYGVAGARRTVSGELRDHIKQSSRRLSPISDQMEPQSGSEGGRGRRM